MNDFRIKFHGGMPPNYEKVVQKVHKELYYLNRDLDGRPEDLIFHIVLLSQDDNGPSVFCWGDQDYPGIFQCEYSARTKWTSLKDRD